jgi:hypothetical protein
VKKRRAHEFAVSLADALWRLILKITVNHFHTLTIAFRTLLYAYETNIMIIGGSEVLLSYYLYPRYYFRVGLSGNAPPKFL